MLDRLIKIIYVNFLKSNVVGDNNLTPGAIYFQSGYDEFGWLNRMAKFWFFSPFEGEAWRI